MFNPRTVALTLAWLISALSAEGALAQAAPKDYTIEPLAMRSARVDGLARSDGEVASTQTVHVPGARWLRLRFAALALPAGGKLRITSLRDGAQQTLTARTLAQWEHTTAYFNGDAVTLELLANRRGRVGSYRLADAMVGTVPPVTDSQCGPKDDRVASNKPDRARVLDSGCTANMMASGCFITAGHCMLEDAYTRVVEFNVPKSNPDGSINHPPPKDQYTMVAGSNVSRFVRDDDWGFFKINPNTETGLTAQQAQGTQGLAFSRKRPTVGQTAEVTGYGWDRDGIDRDTQQTHTGPILNVNVEKATVSYRIDTEGGNSGSAVLVAGKVLAIHTSGGCSSADTGPNGNFGTLVSANQGFRAAYRKHCIAPSAQK